MCGEGAGEGLCWMEPGWVPESQPPPLLPQLALRVSPCVWVHGSTAVPDTPRPRLHVVGAV